MIDLGKFEEQFSHITQLQKDTLESLRTKGQAAVDGYDKLARLNLAVLGDLVDYSVSQARLATTAANAEEFFGRQIDNASAFARVVETRSKEYTALWSDTASAVSADIEEATKATKESVVKAVSKKTA